MGVSLTLKHIKELGPGRFEYRRRVPEADRGTMQKGEFKRVFSATSPAALAREHARIEAEFDRALALEKKGREATSTATPREIWEAALREAQRLTAGVSGLDEDKAREIIAETLEASGKAAPKVIAALTDPDNLHPDNPLPGHTLEDARKLYIKEKLGGGQGDEHREALARVERVIQRVTEALGDDDTALGPIEARGCPEGPGPHVAVSSEGWRGLVPGLGQTGTQGPLCRDQLRPQGV
jgi:hypothetical protein